MCKWELYILKTDFLLVTTPLCVLSYHLTLFRLLWRQACSFFQVSKPSFHWPLRTLVELSPQRAPTNQLALWKVVACFPRRNTQAPPSPLLVLAGGSPLGEKFGHRFPKNCLFLRFIYYSVSSLPVLLFFHFPPQRLDPLLWSAIRHANRSQPSDNSPSPSKHRALMWIVVTRCMWARSVHVAVWLLPAGPLRSQANRISTKHPLFTCLFTRVMNCLQSSISRSELRCCCGAMANCKQ